MKVTIKGDTLIIEMPINSPPVPSASGKTLVVASSRGNVKTTAEIDGKPITVGVNAYIARG